MSLVIAPLGVGERPQSKAMLHKMLHGEAFRTVRTCQLLLDGEPGELTCKQVKENAEHVIAQVNHKLRYVDGKYVGSRYVGSRYVGSRPHARRTISLAMPDVTAKTALDTSEGVIDCYGDLPKEMGQVSRFGMAWWTNDTGHKYIRFFGDRIHLNYKHPEVPRLLPFGQQAYQIVFQCDDPFHCLKCRKNLKIGQGVWVNNSFICEDCKYEHDTGLRPGINKLRKKRSR